MYRSIKRMVIDIGDIQSHQHLQIDPLDSLFYNQWNQIV